MDNLEVRRELTTKNRVGTSRYDFIKRVIDIIISSLGLIMLSPILLIVGISIKLESKGPVFFSQKRVGLNGKEFDMFKFRSMVVNAEELKEKLSSQNVRTNV